MVILQDQQSIYGMIKLTTKKGNKGTQLVATYTMGKQIQATPLTVKMIATTADAQI